DHRRQPPNELPAQGLTAQALLYLRGAVARAYATGDQQGCWRLDPCDIIREAACALHIDITWLICRSAKSKLVGLRSYVQHSPIYFGHDSRRTTTDLGRVVATRL